MSANVLKPPYKDQYLNVYEKGALIAMCIDIIIRERSNGERGILDLMQKLTNEYGSKKPFSDDELFDKITQLTYPEVGQFLTKHVSGTTPIPYEYYSEKVGVAKGKIKKASNPFLNGKEPVVTINQSTKEIVIRPNVTLGTCLTQLGLQSDDTILAINGVTYTLDSVYDMMTSVQDWKEGQSISIKIKRNGKEQTLTGSAQVTYNETEGYQVTNPSKQPLHDAWLKR
jgi:predicted metalloprotease with PDZ domain